jgi:adenosine deaminase
MTNINPTFPLVELHRHLDGNVRLETIFDIAQKKNIPIPATSVEELRPFVVVTEAKPGILDFFKKFEYLTAVMVDYESCWRIAYENIEDAKNEGIDYIELRFSPWFMAEKNNLDPQAVVEAVCDGVQSGCRDFGIMANLIGIISRTYGPDICFKELKALLSKKERIIALDLAGDEINYPGDLFVEHFRVARDAGWHSCPHAGEVDGPESVWQALEELGAERLGHAVHAVEDPELLDYLAENKIGIESNLTSNVQTSTVTDYASHPLKIFLNHGILATINTDDPGISAIDISYEYDVAAPKAGLDTAAIWKAQENALACAFLSDEEKALLISKKQNLL